MRIGVLGATAAGVVMLAWPAFGISQNDHDDCNGRENDRIITGCTHIVEDGAESPEDRIAALGNRAKAWHRKGNDDRAIEDYSEAIRIDPKNIVPYNARGVLWRNKGQLDRAIADFSEAIRLSPDMPPLYDNRGDANLAFSRYSAAAADYNTLIHLNPKYRPAYGKRGVVNFIQGNFKPAVSDFLMANDPPGGWNSLMLFVTRAHLGEDGKEELLRNMARLETKRWPYPVLDFYVGRRSRDELMSAAEAALLFGPCEARFFLGEWQLMHGMKAEAESLFRSAADTCPKHTYAYHTATAELALLKP